MNPLQISLVLSKVISFCHLDDLKSCRLVCSSWKEECKPHIRSRAKISFGTEKNFGEDIKTIQEFSKLMKNNSCEYLPMGKFRFCGPAVFEIENFFYHFGLSISTFCLDLLHIEIEPSELTILLFTANFESVKELELKNLPSSFHSEGSMFPDPNKVPILGSVKKISLTQKCSFRITLDLLTMCPNITELSFGNCENIHPQIHALDSILRSKSPPRIQKINFHEVHFGFQCGRQLLNILIKSNLKLKSLKFSNCTLKDQNNELGNLFSQVLEKQSQTLQQLSLPAPGLKESFGFKFHEMTFLQKISFPKLPLNCSFPSVSHYFPTLQVLDLKHLDIRNFQISLQGFSVRQEKQEIPTLVLPTGLKLSHHAFVEMLAKIFPRINSITVCYEEPEILETILSGWPGITGLNISEKNYSNNVNNENCSEFIQNKYNAAYLGIGTYDCSRLNETFSSSSVELIDYRKSSLKDMQELRSLKISSQFVTDIIGYLGISKLKKLHYLELQCPCISKDCLKYLRENSPKLTICTKK